MQFYQKIPIINKGRHLFRRLFFISHGHIKNEAEKIDVTGGHTSGKAIKKRRSTQQAKLKIQAEA